MIILRSPHTSPYFNLAAEEYLFKQHHEDILFLYINEPSVIVGTNQVIKNEVNLEYCKENEIHVARRMSGGGAVFHDAGNLNYCFITNKKGDQNSINGDFLLPVVQVFNELNVPLTIGKRFDLWLPGNFKVSGTASNISKNRELHHGTLLLNASLENLQKALSVPEKDLSLKGTLSVPSNVKNISTYLTEEKIHLTESEFVDVIIEKFERFYNTKSRLLSNEKDIIDIARSKYETKDWIFRK